MALCESTLQGHRAGHTISLERLYVRYEYVMALQDVLATYLQAYFPMFRYGCVQRSSSQVRITPGKWYR